MANLTGTIWKFVKGSHGPTTGSGVYNITGSIYQLDSKGSTVRTYASDSTYKYVYLTSGSMFAFTDGNGHLKSGSSSTGLGYWYVSASQVFNTCRAHYNGSINAIDGEIDNAFLHITGGSGATSDALETWLNAHAVKTCTITNAISNCQLSPLSCGMNTSYTGHITPNSGFLLPASVSVGGTSYSVNSSGNFTIPKVISNITVTGSAAAVKVKSYTFPSGVVDDPGNTKEIKINLVPGSYNISKWKYFPIFKIGTSVLQWDSAQIVDNQFTISWASQIAMNFVCRNGLTSRSWTIGLYIRTLHRTDPDVDPIDTKVADLSFSTTVSGSGPSFLSGFTVSCTPQLQYHGNWVSQSQIISGFKRLDGGVASQRAVVTFGSGYKNYIQLKNPNRTVGSPGDYPITGTRMQLYFDGILIGEIPLSTTTTANIPIPDSILFKNSTGKFSIKVTDPRGYSITRVIDTTYNVVAYSKPSFTGLSVDRSISSDGLPIVSASGTYTRFQFNTSDSSTATNTPQIWYVALSQSDANYTTEKNILNGKYMGSSIAASRAVSGTDYSVTGGVVTFKDDFARDFLINNQNKSCIIMIWYTDYLSQDIYTSWWDKQYKRIVVSSLSLVNTYAPVLALVGPTLLNPEEGQEAYSKQRVAINMGTPTIAIDPLHVEGGIAVEHSDFHKYMRAGSEGIDISNRGRACMIWHQDALDWNYATGDWGDDTIVVGYPEEIDMKVGDYQHNMENAKIKVGDLVINYDYSLGDIPIYVYRVSKLGLMVPSACGIGLTLEKFLTRAGGVTFPRYDWDGSSFSDASSPVSVDRIIGTSSGATLNDWLTKIPGIGSGGEKWLMSARSVLSIFPHINGGYDYRNNSHFYAPTSSGTAGNFLRSTGGAPEWVTIYVPTEKGGLNQVLTPSGAESGAPVWKSLVYPFMHNVTITGPDNTGTACEINFNIITNTSITYSNTRKDIFMSNGIALYGSPSIRYTSGYIKRGSSYYPLIGIHFTTQESTANRLYYSYITDTNGYNGNNYFSVSNSDSSVTLSDSKVVQLSGIEY